GLPRPRKFREKVDNPGIPVLTSNRRIDPGGAGTGGSSYATKEFARQHPDRQEPHYSRAAFRRTIRTVRRESADHRKKRGRPGGRPRLRNSPERSSPGRRKGGTAAPPDSRSAGERIRAPQGRRRDRNPAPPRQSGSRPHRVLQPGPDQGRSRTGDFSQ